MYPAQKVLFSNSGSSLLDATFVSQQTRHQKNCHFLLIQHITRKLLRRPGRRESADKKLFNYGQDYGKIRAGERPSTRRNVNVPRPSSGHTPVTHDSGITGCSRSDERTAPRAIITTGAGECYGVEKTRAISCRRCRTSCRHWQRCGKGPGAPGEGADGVLCSRMDTPHGAVPSSTMPDSRRWSWSRLSKVFWTRPGLGLTVIMRDCIACVVVFGVVD